MNNTLKLALGYSQKLKWSIIPAKVGRIEYGKAKKIFPIQWGEFQNRIASEEEINKWYTENPDWGIAVICGKISNLAVLDIDNPKIDLSKYNLPETWTVKTGRGFHQYFRLPENITIKGTIDIEEGLELKGDGATVHAPPTLYSGNIKYKWILVNTIGGLPELPKSLIEFVNLEKNKKIEYKNWGAITQGVGNGMRNQTAASFVGKLLFNFKESDWESFVWPLFKMWNEKNNPPLSERELRITFESIASNQLANRDNLEIKVGSKRKLIEEFKND